MIVINTRIKELRQNLGLTQAQFSERLGLSRNYIGLIEIGDRVPSDRTVSDICREFGADETWLRTGVGDPFPKKTRNDELAAFFGNVLSDEPGFKQRLLSVLSRLDESEWALLEHMADKLLAEEQKEKAGH